MRTVYRQPHAEFRVVGWSAGADEVLLLRRPAIGQVDLAWITLRDGGTRVVLPLPAGSDVSLHPNGRDLLTDKQPDAPDKRDLMIADMLTGEMRPLLTEPANDAMPVWLPDGRHVLFASDRGGTFGAWLTYVGEQATEPQQIRGSMGYWQPIGFGAHHELYYVAQTGTIDVYTASINIGSGVLGARRAVATSFRGRNLFSDWAPDGRHLAFTSRRGAINFAPSSQYIRVIRDLGWDGNGYFRLRLRISARFGGPRTDADSPCRCRRPHPACGFSMCARAELSSRPTRPTSYGMLTGRQTESCCCSSRAHSPGAFSKP